MIAADVPAALLAIGIVALCASTAISALSLPRWSFARRRRLRTQLALPSVPVRRVVTGRPAALPPGPLPPRPAAPPRQRATPTDGRFHDHAGAPVDDLDDAAAVIDDLLEHDPQRLAHMMTAWINDDTSTTWPADRGDRR